MAAVHAVDRSPPLPAHVLLIPFPLKGHLLPLLDLAAVLADAAGLSVTVAVPTATVPLLAPLLSKKPSVDVLSLPLPPVDGVPAALHAHTGLRDPLAAWIISRSSSDSPVTAIVADFFCGWTQPVAAELNVKHLVFSPSGAFGAALVHAAFRLKLKKPENEKEAIVFPSLPGSPAFEWRQLSKLYQLCVENDGSPVFESARKNFALNLGSHGFVCNTFYALESAYLSHPLEDLGFKKVFAVGPLAPIVDGGGARGGAASVPVADVMAWLDTFTHGSVIHICFGSQAALSLTQATALAGALEHCGAPFVWALPAGAELPPQFEARAAASKKGLVIRGWAPQVAILRHPAVGWFVTHCGWNSALEAVAAGVAMLAWPLTADQFYNARLLVEEVKVAVACAGGEKADPDVAMLMDALRRAVAGDDGKVVRKRAREMAEEAASAVAVGGSSWRDVGELVRELQTPAKK